MIESQSKIMKQTLNNVNIAEDRLLSEENACMAAAKHSSKDIIDGFNTGLKHHKYVCCSFVLPLFIFCF